MIIRALGAFSGGLDSMIAAKVLLDQHIEVEAVSFSSPFFESDAGRTGAVQLGISWREIDYSATIMSLLVNPPSGFGNNCNPCIDCHAGMFRKLGEIASAEGFDFIFSGEVAGQRPMSQNRGSLNRVARLSGFKEILLRPLSAKLLPPTDPEKRGLVDRSRLLRLSGRSRKPQILIAEEHGFQYKPPGGGCLLTDPNYCSRLKMLMDIPGLLTELNSRLIRYGRIFRLSEDTIGLVGRSEEDNERLEDLAQKGGKITYALPDRPGPTGVLIGDKNNLEELKTLVKARVKPCI
ncbi:MAG: tRNA 4-thiouridine(8) synthase ThiI [Candidatus Aegiribacteria sp.]|nr:tRNA 4-thiouridine(8) synthase ThiI [Candidatus Aegiribacteria sp.]